MKENIFNFVTVKKLIALAMFLLIVVSRISVSAQTAKLRIDWDNDIRAISLNDIPSFKCDYDDYLRFSPAAAMIMMRACGVEGRSKVGAEWLSAEVFSAGIMVAAVNGLKYSVRRTHGNRVHGRDNAPQGIWLEVAVDKFCRLCGRNHNRCIKDNEQSALAYGYSGRRNHRSRGSRAGLSHQRCHI